MSEERVLKPKKTKKNSKFNVLMSNKKTRYLIMLGMMLPFVVAICIFSSIAYREFKNIKDLAGGEQIVVKDENIIKSMNYILRDNPTDLQKEYFAQLKAAVEEGVVDGITADDSMIAELVAKNYVADFYTWTNKRGQYDIGGFYYIYDGEYENSDHYKENVFLKARDGFYKYISYYGNLYGVENLLEVEDVQVVSCQKLSSPYIISEHDSYKQDSEGEWYDYRVNNSYDCYAVSLKWAYKDNSKLDLNQFANSINLGVIKRGGRFEIVEASESTISARTGLVENITTSEASGAEATGNE